MSKCDSKTLKFIARAFGVRAACVYALYTPFICLERHLGCKTARNALQKQARNVFEPVVEGVGCGWRGGGGVSCNLREIPHEDSFSKAGVSVEKGFPHDACMETVGFL